MLIISHHLTGLIWCMHETSYTLHPVLPLKVGQTALHLAVRHGRTSMVRLLLSHGANVNAQDQAGTTALISACDRGHADIVRILLQDPDCDVNLTDKVRIKIT